MKTLFIILFYCLLSISLFAVYSPFDIDSNLNYSGLPPTYSSVKNIVFSGGGILGLAYCGAYGELEQRGIAENIKNYCGVSAGAITAYLCVLGYSAKETTTLIAGTKFDEFLDSSLSISGMVEKSFWSYWSLAIAPYYINRIYYNKGLCTGESIKAWMEARLVEKGFKKTTTFFQLYYSTNKALFVLATNNSKKRITIFSHLTTPNVRVVDALRASMSIPTIFVPVEINGELYSDGGITDNYPIEIFDKLNSSGETIGLVLNSKEEILNPKDKEYPNIMEFMMGVADILKNVNNLRYFENQKNIDRTIFIDTKGISPLSFNLSEENKELLINNGKSAVIEFFKRRYGQ